MVDADDDFDDLYGDLNCDMKVHPNGIEAKISDFETSGNERVDLEDEKVINYSESDEDDDFRILLNSCRKGGFGDEKTILNNENDGINSGSGQEIPHAGSNLEGYPVSCRATIFERDASSDQNGDNFRLPRHRNIFDINIEAFNYRPWSNHGADLTDYFNYGMDENSWKSYWELMNRHRNQVCMSNRQSVYQTSLTNERGSRSSSKESSDTEGRRSDMDHLPKGKAIEVRCGFGERVSSIDMWRPMRSQDPDVVIPIIMETSEDDESASTYKNSIEHAEEHMHASPSTSKIYSNERTPSLHSDCQPQRNVTNSVEHYPPEQSKIPSRSISDKIKSNITCTKDEDHPEKDSFMLERKSRYQARVPCSSNSYNTESHSDDCKEILCKKGKSTIVEVTSVKKVRGNVDSDYSTSENTVNDSAGSEQEDNKNSSDEHDFFSRNQSLSNGRRLKSVAEINTTKDEFDSLDIKKREHNVNNCNNRYSNCEFEPNYRSRKHAAKHHREYCIDQLQIHNYREKSNGVQLQRHNHRRDLGDKDCFKQKEHELTERRHRNQFADDCSKQRGNGFVKRQHTIWDEKKWNTEQDFPERHDHRNWERKYYRGGGEEDGIYQREHDMSERRHFEKWDKGYSSNIKPDYSERGYEERDRKSLIYKYPDRLNFKNDSFREKDLSLHVLDEKEDDWVRMDCECREIADHARFNDRDARVNDRDIQAVHRRRMHCKEMESFDIMCNRQDYRSQRKISPGISRFDERIKFVNRVEQIDDENANYMLDSHRYNDERMHICSPSRDHVLVRSPWRSNRQHVNHGDHCDIRDIHVKEIRNEFIVQNINHHHHLPYEDDLESKNVYHENFVSRIRMRRLGHISKPSLHPQQGVLPSHKRFVSQKSLEHSDLQVKKPLSLKQRLNFDHKLNNVKKIKVEARNPVNVDPRRGKHMVAVNNHLNGFKGKLATKCNGVATESKKAVSNCKIKTLPKNSTQIRKIPMQDETSVSKGKCSSKLRITEDHEVEEGELIEGSQKKNMKTGIKSEDIQPKDSSQSVKVVGMYNNSRILETLKKMEKRRERFKEPIAAKQELVTNSNPQVNISVAAENNSDPQTTEVKERPIRKRKWSGN